jgi:hypothetical protein
VRALNPTTGALLWTGPNIGGTHWQSPIVANGALYVTGGSSRLTAFNLPTTPPTFTSATSVTFQVGTVATFAVRATGSPTPTLMESGALPDGVTFTATTGVLAGTPTSTGTFALQFTATNGVSPDATQRFSLIVDSGPPHPATLTYNEPGCASFAVSGPPTALTFSCAAGGGTGVPVCTPSANPAAPAVGQATTISANCANQPNPNSYVWTGGGCASASGSTCTVTKGRRTSVTYTVQGTNDAGTGSPGSVTVSWR